MPVTRVQLKQQRPGFFSRIFSKRYLVPWAIAAGGIAALTTASIYGGISAHSNQNAFDETYQGFAWQSRDKARKNAVWANVFFGVSGALLVTSAVWFVWEYIRESNELQSIEHKRLLAEGRSRKAPTVQIDPLGLTVRF